MKMFTKRTPVNEKDLFLKIPTIEHLNNSQTSTLNKVSIYLYRYCHYTLSKMSKICISFFVNIIKASCLGTFLFFKFFKNLNISNVDIFSLWTVSKIKTKTIVLQQIDFLLLSTTSCNGAGYFIRYTLLVPFWTSFCLQNYLKSFWHRLNKVLETLERSFHLH